MLTKTQLKEIFAKYSFRPLKRFGENYLVDGNIKDKIINEARLAKDDVVLEIGPGLGALTFDLAVSGARVYAVEKDKKAYDILREMAGDDHPNLTLFNADILDFDFKRLPGDKKIKVVGNLPYYITTPIIERMIENASRFAFALIMVQREVANRLLAVPGGKDCSSISCFIRYHTRPAYIHTVKRGAFYPSPEVDSSIIRLDILEKPSVEAKNEKTLFKVIRGSFNQRRKTIVKSLSREEALDIPKEKLSALLESIGIDPIARPETLSLSDFAKIANSL